LQKYATNKYRSILDKVEVIKLKEYLITLIFFLMKLKGAHINLSSYFKKISEKENKRKLHKKATIKLL
jgi:hypothetical protein